jgi:hypothetical protein
MILSEAIEIEVRSSFTEHEIQTLSFKEFYALVDVQNAFEEGWSARRYKKIYREVFKKLRGEKNESNDQIL